MTRWLLLLLLWSPNAAAAELDPPAELAQAAPEEVAAGPAPSSDSARLLLDTIRDDLVNLRFEKTLAGIEALLGEPSLAESDRAEALVLRSQAHVAFGDLNAAEQDFREILLMQPGYVPDASLTPRKAMERFKQVQARTIGQLTLKLDPPDAAFTVDGREVVPGPGGALPLVAGEHLLRAEREGFDPLERTIVAEAGSQATIEVQLVPNARTVILLTRSAGVDVQLDGLAVGRTVGSGGAGQPAQLILENLPLGEHLFELSKPCFRTERRRDLLTVDLLDRGPKRYGPIALVPVHSTLLLREGPPGATVLVDEELEGRLPLERVELCPGTRRLELLQAGRRIWSSSESLAEGEERLIRIEARPNAVLLGVESEASQLSDFANTFNIVELLALPSGRDLTTEAGWRALGLAPDVDLALARLPSSAALPRPGWYLYSPILHAVAGLPAAPAASARPLWSEASWGFFTVDSAVGGPALVVESRAAGPAAAAGIAAGDRILSLGGSAVRSASEVDGILRFASAKAPLEVEWRSPSGKRGRAQLEAAASIRLEADLQSVEQAILRAAWATVDGAADPLGAQPALANLALLLSEFGRHDRALEAWRRVTWPERRGIGRGTAQYYMGQELERLGREATAVEAYRAAAASEATAVSDDGPSIAPAARDRLADLGVRLPPTSR